MLGPGWADGGTMVARRAGLAYGSGWTLRVRASVLAGRGCRHGHVAVSARLRRRWRKNSTQPARSLPPEEASMLDVVIVGGGPAGLSAALILGRARRNVLLCDSGQPRNAGVHAMHGFLSRDGTDPAALRQAGRDQLRAYPTVRLRAVAVQAVTRDTDQFTVSLTDRTTEQARHLLLATGVIDELPPIPGLAELWGHGVFNCPYCDGWEVRDQPLTVLASDPRNLQLALQLTRWSPDVLLCSNGPADLDDDAERLLAAHKVQLREEPIARLAGHAHRGVPARAHPPAQRPAPRAWLHPGGRRLGAGRRPWAEQRARRVRRRRHGATAQHAGARRAGRHRRGRGRDRRRRHRPGAVPAAARRLRVRRALHARHLVRLARRGDRHRHAVGAVVAVHEVAGGVHALVQDAVGVIHPQAVVGAVGQVQEGEHLGRGAMPGRRAEVDDACHLVAPVAGREA